jgi:molybdenum cofactor synthesis domain-containing protein
MLKKIKVEDAVGLTLGHDMTKVVPGECKTPAFRRGYILRREDIPELLNMGKEHIYIVEEAEGEVHEEEAARRLAQAFAGANLALSGVNEGRIDLKATIHGLLRVDVPLLNEINAVEEIALATLHNYSVCQPGTTIAGTKIIPLYIPDGVLRQVEELCRHRDKVIGVLPFKFTKVGVVVTGNEVLKGRIQDRFGDTMKERVAAYGAYVAHLTIVGDDEEMIAQAILDMQRRRCEVIIACGGFSVDPDDVTTEGVARSGAEIIKYGAPVMPGSMSLIAYLGEIPVLGAPACAIWNKATVIDMLLPRVLAGVRITREDIVALGHGGLCLGCQPCLYPVCPFGK